MERIENISSKIRDKTSVPTFSTTIQHSLEVLAIAIREELKGIQIRKEKCKTLTVLDDMILYTENLRALPDVLVGQGTLCEPWDIFLPGPG